MTSEGKQQSHVLPAGTCDGSESCVLLGQGCSTSTMQRCHLRSSVGEDTNNSTAWMGTGLVLKMSAIAGSSKHSKVLNLQLVSCTRACRALGQLSAPQFQRPLNEAFFLMPLLPDV